MDLGHSAGCGPCSPQRLAVGPCNRVIRVRQARNTDSPGGKRHIDRKYWSHRGGPFESVRYAYLENRWHRWRGECQCGDKVKMGDVLATLSRMRTWLRSRAPDHSPRRNLNAQLTSSGSGSRTQNWRVTTAQTYVNNAQTALNNEQYWQNNALIQNYYAIM